MGATLRLSMTWLHTWAGVVLGGLLFVIFWMGTLSVFDREIDRWMAPMTRLVPSEHVSMDMLRTTLEAAAADRTPFLSVIMPTERQPMIRVLWLKGRKVVTRHLDPASGVALPDPGTLAGTRFLYPFHYMLHVRFGQLGTWLVGLTAMGMLVLCVSGVVIHRKVFVEFFTVRPDRQARRLILDLHNVTGVLGIPFHFAITLSGLILFWSIYFPAGLDMAYSEDRTLFGRETFGAFERPKAGRHGSIGSLDAMIEDARRRWDGDPTRFILVMHPGDAAGYVQLARLAEAQAATSTDTAYYDAATGALLHLHTYSRPVMTVQRFIGGLHVIQFRHWTLRWLYFGLGLAGCVVIATGSLFWLESRRKRHARLGLWGTAVVDGLTVGSVAGILVATLSFFAINRLLPPEITLAGYDRAALEIWTFYLTWLVTFAHAWLRPRRSWIEQCRTIAVLATAAVVLNWLTTGDHLLRSLSHRHLWPIACMDLLLLIGGAVAADSARRLAKRLAEPPASQAPSIR